ncbi:MAG: cob(I)yrinic acid a,c-diamide adenosyltransferase [Patescibacteria group bacterium]
MKLYTKTGDKGETSLLGGRRVLKSELQIEANGGLDEASSYLGWTREVVEEDRARNILQTVQQDLYEVMGYIAGSKLSAQDLAKKTNQIELVIDKVSKTLPPLTQFIIPQGGEVATRFHIARTVVRSAERRFVKFVYEKYKYHTEEVVHEKNTDFQVIQYLNRLSDMCFAYARKFAQVEKVTKKAKV